MYCTANPTETGVALPALFRGTAQPARYDTPAPRVPNRTLQLRYRDWGSGAKTSPNPMALGDYFASGPRSDPTGRKPRQTVYNSLYQLAKTMLNEAHLLLPLNG